MADSLASPHDQVSGPRRAALAFIFVTVVLDMLALGMIVPVLPNLVKGFLSDDTARAARIYGLFGTVWALMQFLCSPLLGALSDRYGRRPVILISNFGLGLDYLLMALAPTLGWLFAGRVISGITAASVPTAMAYITDVTPAEKRAGAFGMVGAAFGLGFILGPGIGGLLGDIHPRLPFWVAGGFSLVNAIYGLFVLPESLPKERRSSFAWRHANPLGSLRLLRSHPELLGLAGVLFLSALAHESLPSTYVLYTTHRYGWTETTVGLTLLGMGICSSVVQGFLIRPAVGALGERRALLVALCCGAMGFAVYGCASTSLLFFGGLPWIALWGIGGPAAQGIMTGHVSPTEQGQLQGATNSLRGIAGLFGPGIFTQTFAVFITTTSKQRLSGAPFLLASVLLLSSAALAAYVTGRHKGVPATTLAG